MNKYHVLCALRTKIIYRNWHICVIMCYSFPFEKMVRENENLSLIRLYMNEAVVPESFGNRAVGIGGDMAKVISDLRDGIRA